VGFAMANFLTCAGALHRGAENGGPKHLMLILFSMINLYICDCAKLLKCWEKMLPYVADNGLNYIGWICWKSLEKNRQNKQITIPRTPNRIKHTHIYIYTNKCINEVLDITVEEHTCKTRGSHICIPVGSYQGAHILQWTNINNFWIILL
jgi:hypothetical protein